MISTFRLITIGAHALIECRLCWAASPNPGDIVNRYCASCHLFLEVVDDARDAAEHPDATHDCGEWQTARQLCALCGRAGDGHAHDWRPLPGAMGRLHLPTGPPPAHTIVHANECGTCGAVSVFPESNYALAAPSVRVAFEAACRALGRAFIDRLRC